MVGIEIQRLQMKGCSEMTNAQAVLEVVSSAFPLSPIPPAHANAPAPLIADAAAFAQTLNGKAWNSVTLAELRSDLFGIFHIDDAAYRYYLPAYLSLTVRDYHRMDFLVETLLQSLASPDYGSLTEIDIAQLKEGWKKSRNARALDETVKNAARREPGDIAPYRARMGGLGKRKLEALASFLTWLRSAHGEDDANSLISKAEISVLELLQLNAGSTHE